MKRTKQLLSLLLALVLALSLVSPALAAETDDASGVTADTLTQLLGQAPTFPEGASASDGITNQEAAAWRKASGVPPPLTTTPWPTAWA